MDFLLPDLSNGVELLVHNLSHSDIVLDVKPVNNMTDGRTALARPKFSNYRSITKELFIKCEEVKEQTKAGTIPTIKKAMYSCDDNDYSKQVPSSEEYPCGMDISSSPYAVDAVNLRFRRDDKSVACPDDSSVCFIDKLYFPLASILIPNWLTKIEEQGRSNFTKILILTSGAGTPTDSESRALDNSTKYTGKIITEFINQCYSDIIIIHIHSKTNLFRYDENIAFAKNELMAPIHAIRRILSSTHGSEWKNYMKVSLSFADGSSARISAIQASMKYYKPDFFHFWRLKSFWTEEVFNRNDIECHSFEEMSMDPAIDARELDGNIKAVYDEMQRFRTEFLNRIVQAKEANDLSDFWLRKTKKPVLAVLLVQRGNEEPKLYRGTNMEVSMPTGSLCAERNVIGTALAADLTLKREDLRMIAVYSLPKIGQIDVQAMDASPVADRTRSNSTLSSNSNDDNVEGRRGSIKGKTTRLFPFSPPENDNPSPRNKNGEVKMPKTESFGSLSKSKITRSLSFHNNMSLSSFRAAETCEVYTKGIDGLCGGIEGTAPSTDGLDQHLDSKIPGMSEKAETHQHYTSKLCVATSENDTNPLKPCGACAEWLKKISEVNPQFAVVTFTDKDCRGVFIEEIAD